MKQRADDLLPNDDVNNGGYFQKIQLVSDEFNYLTNEEIFQQAASQEQLKQVS